MMIRPVADLQNDWKGISGYCKEFNKPVYLTEDGTGDCVLMSMKQYNRLEQKLEALANRTRDIEHELDIYSSIKGLPLEQICQRAFGD